MNLIYVLFTIFILFQIAESSSCKWQQPENAPEVYWINLDHSRERKISMEKHLNEIGLRHFRVRGFYPKDIFIPPDIEATWRTAWCQMNTEWNPPERNSSHTYLAYTNSLCGRGKKKNTPKELGCTTSHLLAMYQAIYSPTAKSRYALIIEDDLFFPFNIDFDKLVTSAPNDFVILQLFNSNQKTMESTWQRYMKSPSDLWILTNTASFAFWSTCAYLIDRERLKPILDNVVRKHLGWYRFDIIAGITSPCVPNECCPNKDNKFTGAVPCIYAPRGYQADSYLYSLAQTYCTSIPILTNGQGGNTSTFHQDHVELFHKSAFRLQRSIVNRLYTDISPPSFMTPACKAKLDENAI